MYLDYFGLDRPPFKITPDASMFFSGGDRGDALEALIYAILNGEGIVKVVGEVGSGKTMLCRMLELKLPDSVEIVYIANPKLSPDNIIQVIAFELHLEIDEDTSRLHAMQKLQKYLLERHAAGRQIVMFVEEAQGMPIATLEEIRLISNLETDQNKLLQIVLFGQPELDENLSSNEIRQLRERITHSFYLEPFTTDEILRYLNFRMTVAGYHGPDIFDLKSARLIEKYSQGLLRRINILADKILICAFSEQTHTVSKKHIVRAVADSEFHDNIPKTSWVKHIAYAACLLLFLGIGFAGATVWLNISKPVNVNTPDSINVSAQLPEQQPPPEPSEPADANTPAPEIKVSMETASAPKATAEKNMGKTVAETATETTEAIPGPINGQVVSSTMPEQTQAIDSKPASIARETEATGLPATASLLERRLKATQEMLSETSPDAYTIQLMTLHARHVESLNQYLRNLANDPVLNSVYLYKVGSGDRIYYGVLYKVYPTKGEAYAMLEKIPRILKANTPLPRAISDIKGTVQ